MQHPALFKSLAFFFCKPYSYTWKIRESALCGYAVTQPSLSPSPKLCFLHFLFPYIALISQKQDIVQCLGPIHTNLSTDTDSTTYLAIWFGQRISTLSLSLVSSVNTYVHSSWLLGKCFKKRVVAKCYIRWSLEMPTRFSTWISLMTSARPTSVVMG